MPKLLRSAETVGRGHPDKIADLIADSILDALIEKLGREKTRLSAEVLVSNKKVLIAGEGSSHSEVSFEEIAKKILYLSGYEPDKFEILLDYKEQSKELSQLVTGCNFSNDQGIVFGFATKESKELLPLEHLLVKKLALKTLELREDETLWWAKEDFKVLAQLELTYSDTDRFQSARLNTLVFSIQHLDLVPQSQIETELKLRVIFPILEELNISYDSNTAWLINPSGSFLIGGLEADSGLTNRKQIADSFGPVAHHGGGGLSGKDLTKIDRLGAYYARWVTKNIVAVGLAQELELKIVYAIGQPEALSYTLTHSKGLKFKPEKLTDLIQSCFPTKVKEIFNYFNSFEFSFSELAEKSHFGLNTDLPWEQLNRAKELYDWIRNT
ncbi:S-adenosylmethionine synthetase [Mycoplasma wenyonii str. Massachusetts]|uniref:S-adenosylmethionine synthetase n=1 Tax=Mycoplasma wenyonii (strain Massachusetts) TaxID=1197325 RepID=I6ZES1_MYCWM|nr:methionine adenosyltransferase [Mycoplasma wenyonii]AFN65097.1 S-adenosylmethionine synthetase [Mycoplasma wenyonii str. Massachusetts]